MVCEHCGNLLREGATVCDQCGAQIIAPHRGEGISGRRQGRADKARVERVGSAMLPEDAPLLPDAVMTSRRRPRTEGAGRPAARRGTPPPPTTGRQMGRSKREKPRPARRMMVNWALVWTIVLGLVFVCLIGGFVFLKTTDSGQLILARMGKDADAQALWTYGQELLDQGYIERSIAVFEQAYAQEPEREDIYDRLQQLADAYETAGRSGDAEEIYRQLAEMEPTNPTAYQAIVRMMESQDRRLELSAFLKDAYEKTNETSFRRQREDLIPTTPTTSLEGGSLLRERDVELQSKEDYDIYYLFGEDGLLPEDGTLYEAPIHLTEGTHLLRAVAVSNDLISDELSVQYTINLPVPSAPVSSLAPGPYETRQRIWLRYVESEEEKAADDPKQKDITIYYTIDGQTPTSNSPIYTGEPFYLPGGKSVKVKAVAVNGYGKVSNVMEREYKINIPFKRYFNDSDEFSDFTLMKTTRDAFVKKYGTPVEEIEIEDSTVVGEALKLSYSWGEARFFYTESGLVLYAVTTNSASMTAPRKTKVGMSETDVTEKFRDMGQTYDQNGDRSIYYDENEGYAKLYHLDASSDRLDYVRYRTDNGVVTLSYFLENGQVTQISLRCSYQK